ncbi:MAG TPA: cbb3-type cytochrome c oxidase subunit II [Gemmatimonadales bacterium]|jgi:cytochrome c oxidase cbb3-type subunit 2
MRLDFHNNHRLLFGVVLFGFIGLSYLVAIAPAISVHRTTSPLAGSRPLNALERQGLEIYLSEGCVYCHTQQVRPLAQDTLRYGRASVPGDFAWLAPTDVWRQTPRILGSERTGPDLSSIGVRQPSAVWQYIHLFQPRAVTTGSIMPAFPWLFEVKKAPDTGDTVVPIPPAVAPKHGVVIARQEAKALVAYLLSLRQVPLDGVQPAPGTVTRSGDAGAKVFETRCSSCHQPAGQGLPGAFPPLVGDPVVLASDPGRHVEIVLFGLTGEIIGGVSYASPMPAWADLLSDEEIAAVINHERTSWGNKAPSVTPELVGEIRARGRHAQ